MPLNHEITCLTCFHKYPPEEASFRCDNDTCTGRAFDPEYFAVFGIADDGTHNIGRVLDPVTTLHNGQQVREARLSRSCDVCGVETKMRICPHCHDTLSPHAGEVDLRILSFVGSVSSGKSHLMATMVQRLEKGAGASLDLAPLLVGGESIQRWNEDFKAPLFDRWKQLPNTKVNDPRSRIPIIYNVRRRRVLGVESLDLPIFDTPGEDFKKQKTIEKYARQFALSTGIFLLIDPLQIQQIREYFEQHGLALPPIDNNAKPGTLLALLDSTLPAQRDIPIAIVLTKLDAIVPLLDPGSPLLLPIEHQNQVNLEAIERHSAEVEDVLRTYGELNFVTNIPQRYPQVRFFAVAALGADFVSGKLPSSPQCFGVEDALFWILKKKNLVP